MPRSVSAKKRVRQNETRRIRNRTIKSRIRSARRDFLAAVAADDADKARDLFLKCEKMLHRAANNGPLHRKTAGRVIGRLRMRLTGLQRAANAAAP
ncbi:MAG: 30S ribosomal protein S20 [Planctomycetota bacterium]|nr:30S ribosomal protein S20 [Planctomycetota bacterium]